MNLSNFTPRKRFFLLLFTILTLSTTAQQTRNVLFIGNSYTYVNDLPSLIQQMAHSAGNSITYTSNTPGGCTFQQHCSNQSMDLIRRGGWDVVVLQEQSQLPAFPQSQVETECLPYATQLVDSIRVHNPHAEPMFYMTWGRRDGDQQNAPYFPVLATYWGMDSMLYERYMQMKEDNDASICPVGRVWRYLRQNRPFINLYDSDGSHPSRAGSVCAAYAFYTMFFHEPAANVPYIPSLGVDSIICSWMKAATDSIVYNNLAFWQMTLDTTIVPPDTTIVPPDTTIVPPDTIIVPPDTVSIQTASVDAFTLYPNPASDQVTVDLPQSGTLEIYDLQGRCILRRKMEEGSHPLDLTSLPSCHVYLTVFNRTRQLLLKR